MSESVGPQVKGGPGLDWGSVATELIERADQAPRAPGPLSAFLTWAHEADADPSAALFDLWADTVGGAWSHAQLNDVRALLR